MNLIKRRNFNKGVSLVFVEMIVSLLFFSVSCVIILNVFAAADSKSEKSRINEHINLTIQSVCEVFHVTGDIDETCKTIFGDDVVVYTAEIASDKFRSSHVLLNSECVYDGVSENIQLHISTEVVSTNSAGSLVKLRCHANYKGEKVYETTAAAYFDTIQDI